MAKNKAPKKLLIYIVVVVLAAFGIFFYTSLQPKADPKSATLGVASNASAVLSPATEATFAREKQAVIDQIQKEISDLSKIQKVGRLFMISIPGPVVQKETIDFINRLQIGGVIIMGGNIQGPDQLKGFIKELRSKVDHPLLIAVDQEGYPVARVNWDPTSSNSASELRSTSIQDLTSLTQKRAKLLRQLGFDINFAPVADLDFAGSWISERSFGLDPDKVTSQVVTIFEAQQREQLASAAKHFPGLGRSNIDSHEFLPIISASRRELDTLDLIPFKALIDKDIEFIMIGHGLYPALDESLPASISSKIQTELLRDELGFEGLIVSDDMKMGALNGYTDKYNKALQAGTNILLLIDYLPEIEEAIETTAATTESDTLDKRLMELMKSKVLCERCTGLGIK